MLRATPLFVIAALAVPATAQAADPQVTSASLSDGGVLAVGVKNPNRHALSGSVNVIAGQQIVASRSVKLGTRAAKRLTWTLEEGAVDAIRTAKGRTTVALKTRRKGGKARTVRRTFTLKLPKTSPVPAGQPAPGGSAAQPGAGVPAAPAGGPQRYVGRLGTEGAYDDFELTRDGATFTLTKPALLPTTCSKLGGDYAVAASVELFDAVGPWTIGTDGQIAKPGSVAVNPLVTSGARTITYTVRGSAVTASGAVTGTLGMSFSDPKVDVFTGNLYFVNCAGTQGFEAVPAPS